MSLDFTLVLRAETAAAKAELEAATRGIQGVSAATDKATTASKAGAAADRAAATAKQANARAATQLATANRQAAGATGNLVAQFNDIGMMLAAGQNPLQLAIQQGTSITQVIGPMGAAGAARALGEAFVSMLNPLNLITLGVIAAGAATVQWLMGASEDTVSFADSVDTLSNKADAYVTAVRLARSSTAELRGEFGETGREIRSLLKDMADLELRETQRQARQSSQDLQSQIGIFDGPEFGVGNQKNLADMFDLSVWSRESRVAVNSVLDAFRDLDSAGTLDEQIAAAESLKARFTEAAMASGEISEAEDAVLAPLNEMILTLIRVRGEQQGVTGEVVETKATADDLNRIIDAMAGNLARMAGISLSGVFASAQGPANTLLDTVVRIGTTMYNMAAFQKTQQQLAADGLVYSGRGGDPRTSNQQGYGEFVYTGPALDAFNNPIVSGGSGSGSGGGAAARDEASALQELITGLEGEIAALRVTNPIQAEMLQHREALTGATEAERLKVEELIATREREKAATEMLQFAGESAGNALIDALMGADDAGKKLIQTLIQAALQAAILGEGPLAGLFGGTSLFANVASLVGGGKAAGGMIYGPGTGTSDSILTPLSNGEFVVNAKATARNRQLLEAINAGSRMGPGLASGGMAGGGDGSLTGRSGRQMPATVLIDLRGAQGDREIEEKVRRGAAQVVALYDREGLAVGVQRVSRDPKRRG